MMTASFLGFMSWFIGVVQTLSPHLDYGNISGVFLSHLFYRLEGV